MKLILFDIDGTLLSAGGAGTRSLELAFRDQFDIENAFQDISMAGKTDPQIIREGLVHHGLPGENGIVPRLIAAYLTHLAEEMRKSKKKHLKPGVLAALRALSAMPDFSVGLLTGNLEAGARIKLETFAIYRHFICGAFGSDHEDRNQLLPIAMQRFMDMHGRPIEARQCIIVGDTPRDVACSKPYGARCIAVATGPYDRGILDETDADEVFDDLADTARFLAAVEAL
ncbi:MAG TPA: HAD family hydrolase [Dissulfurispiraceae bacterium]|nr:HAD family hydrolase [Dissulfurispiraceae bacterium]